MKANGKRVGVVLLGITLSVLTCVSSGIRLQAREPANIGSREAEDVTVAARHPEKGDRLVLDAPIYNRAEPNDPPDGVPDPGVPLNVHPRNVPWR